MSWTPRGAWWEREKSKFKVYGCAGVAGTGLFPPECDKL